MLRGPLRPSNRKLAHLLPDDSRAELRVLIEQVASADILPLVADVFLDDHQAKMTVSHEIGHFIDWIVEKQPGIPRGNLLGRMASLYKHMKQHYNGILASNKSVRKELKALTQLIKPFDITADPKYTRYRHSSAELYADAMSVLFNDPGLLQRTAPGFFAGFRDFIDKKGRLEADYTYIQKVMTDPAALKKRPSWRYKTTRALWTA